MTTEQTPFERWQAWIVGGAKGNPPSRVSIALMCEHCGETLRCYRGDDGPCCAKDAANVLERGKITDLEESSQ